VYSGIGVAMDVGGDVSIPPGRPRVFGDARSSPGFSGVHGGPLLHPGRTDEPVLNHVRRDHNIPAADGSKRRPGDGSIANSLRILVADTTNDSTSTAGRQPRVK
jgi:hypothetical protein